MRAQDFQQGGPNEEPTTCRRPSGQSQIDRDDLDNCEVYGKVRHAHLL